MLKIYGAYRSRASRNIWLAGELGIPFELVPVLQAYRVADPTATGAPINTRSLPFLAINPNGHTPAIDDDGVVMWESLAINLYLAKKHGGPLAPASAREDGLMTMWTLWAVTELETQALALLMHTSGKPAAERDPAIAAAAMKALPAPLAVLDRALAVTGHLVGDRFTVADLNVAEVVRYASAVPALIAACPHVRAWLDACHARPVFKAMWAAREAEPV